LQGEIEMSSATTERPSLVENIKVLQIGKFGVRVDEKTWYNVNAPLTSNHFAVGTGYKVSLSVAKSGKKYINEILGVESAEGAPAAAVPAAIPASLSSPATPSPAHVPHATPPGAGTAPATARPTRAGYDKPLTEYDLAKDAQIAKSGIIQAALQSPGIVQWSTNLDEYMSNVRKVADFALQYVKG
jgi:hypothetical protein